MTNLKPPLGNIQNAMELGKMVVGQRKAQGLTQSDLAGLAQTGTGFISDLENGKGTVQFDKVMHILNLLGLDVVDRPTDKPSGFCHGQGQAAAPAFHRHEDYSAVVGAWQCARPKAVRNTAAAHPFSQGRPR
ncbi:MAG: helix-turn-helix transcriptional regulator [Methylomonas sp.]|nr:helix-turn-helix transcriptional regulator [Methylomonas sp.]PPD19688.1 MAG: hypothetical protein CTY23_11180 [Methylomonas sp.]PPD25814.1 MAG: hypothetical protein CTY22_07200 [Methylomonas sp.]PPD37273.1 MAG: hypothetical protein CTY21_07200 [Methylomonas sp.]PPD39039.1 MAG: hypothetical protein CTY17_08540 [Methylomonas sp.]